MQAELEPATQVDAVARPIARREYDRLVDLGLLVGEPLELLRGALVAVSPQGSAHAAAVRRLNTLLVPLLVGRAQVQPGLPFAATDDSEPEPDIALVGLGDFLDGHPQQAYLAVEVSWSSLRRDRRLKGPIYAEAGVPEYWIVNLVDRVLEVYRAPRGGAYTERAVLRPGERTALVAFPDVTVAVEDLLPEGAA